MIRALDIAFPIAAFLAMSAALTAVGLANNPCPTEDSTWCTWDATSRGNGNGESFIALWEGATIYLP